MSAFLDAFDCSANAWESVDSWGRSGIRRWLKKVLTKGGKELEIHRTKTERQAEFLRLVEAVVNDFVPHEIDPEIRIAPRFTPTGPLAKFAGSTRRQLPASISRGIIRFVWWGVPGSTTTWEINAFDLPDGKSVYWIGTEFGCEDENEKRFIFATGNSDERVIELFFASDGKDFGVDGPGGSPPQEIATNLPRGEFLTNAFVSLFSAARAWARIETKEALGLDRSDPVQQKMLVERWFDEVVR